MAGWPWPLDGLQAWFEGLWNWIVAAAQNAVSVVSEWIWSAIYWAHDTLLEGIRWVTNSVGGFVTSLWIGIVGAVGNLWNSISAGINGLWTSVAGAFGSLWTNVSWAFFNIWLGIVGVVGNLWNSISSGLSGLWNSISGAVGSAVNTINGALGSLWTGFVSFMGNVANGINQGIQAVGSAVGSAVNTIGGWVSEALKGVAAAMGTALQGFIDWLVKGMGNIAIAIGGFLTRDVLTPLGTVLSGFGSWVVSAVVGLFQQVLQFFASPHSPDPENPVGSIAEMLTTVLGFTVSMALPLVCGELVHPLKELGLGHLSAMMYDMAGFGRITSALTLELATISYITPLRWSLNQLWRPRIPSTMVADQMFFEEHITKAEWRDIYQKWGWKEQHIDAWFKTMWREPSILILRAMAADPDTDPEWVRKKLRELAYIGEDAEAIIAYGKRQQLKDERTAMATQIQYDLVDGVISYDDARADLLALKFSPEEVEYRLSKAYLIIQRNERRAAQKLASDIAKASDKAKVTAEEQAKTEAALAAKKIKKLSESDYDKELELGLTTPSRYIADMVSVGYPEDLAKRKYAIQVTPKPITAEELERRRRLIQTRISRTGRRYDFVIARHDLQTGFLADTIEYLSSLEKPPATRIATLQAQLVKAADEKALILAERDAEISELEDELKLVQAG